MFAKILGSVVIATLGEAEGDCSGNRWTMDIGLNGYEIVTIPNSNPIFIFLNTYIIIPVSINCRYQ
jgi:hypothetical protein